MDADVILRNCVNVNDLEDPVMPVDAIIKRCGAEQLMVHYNVPAFQNAMQLCMHMAVKTGKLKKGGICDVASAAKNILLDWNSGKVPFYTKPPSVKKGTHVSAEILSQLSADFDLKKVDKDSKTIMASLPELAGMEWHRCHLFPHSYFNYFVLCPSCACIRWSTGHGVSSYGCQDFIQPA